MRFKIKIAMYVFSLLTLVVLYVLWFHFDNTLNLLINDPNSGNIELVASQLSIILAMVFVLITIMIIIGIVSARLVASDIFKLRDAAREIGRGKLKTRINIKTGDEVEELAESLNRMAGDLEQSKKDLEAKNLELESAVKKRTKELQSKVGVLERLNKLAVGRELRMIQLKDRVKELESKLIKRK